MRNYNKYLLHGEQEENWGFYITTAGYTKIAANQTYPLNSQHPDTHKFNWDSGRILDGFYLVFITMGEGLFESAHTQISKIKEGTCFLLFPGVWHRYKPAVKSGWEEYWVGFKGKYPNQVMKNFDLKNPFIVTGRNEQLLLLFHNLIELIQQAKPGYHQILTGITLQMLGLVKSLSSQTKTDVDLDTKLVEDAKFLLREAFADDYNVDQILSKLPVGYSKLRKDFKCVTGLSPNQYRLQLRLEKVKEMLKNTHLNISEIAYQTGFESIAYLSKIFKKKMGVGPREWRDAN